ncbi:hypothetical protein NC653_034716 [Populus alba x Populus x berolinensis]|uniref:Uncharacterized protein n=1 Tax=Populus alba x Populus x berolinensis TaxID=444605 RepID=A0AAD6LND1_9ROSI|nr:hypothetical protein NC653_034716 [Populus alba x Populus x berolinensis]
MEGNGRLLRSHPLWDSNAYDDAHFLTRYIGFTTYSSIFPSKMDKRKDIPSSKDWGRGNLRSQTFTTPVRWHVLRPFQIMLKACFFFNLHALRRLQENSARSMGWTELPYNLSSKHMERNLDR